MQFGEKKTYKQEEIDIMAENESSTCKASFEEMLWMFVYKTVLEICMTVLDISIQYFWYFFGIESICLYDRIGYYTTF